MGSNIWNVQIPDCTGRRHSCFGFSDMILDYVLAYGAVSLGGLVCVRKGKAFGTLQIGYLAGMAARFVVACISGICFYYNEAQSVGANLRYVTAYNGGYILAEG